MRFTHLKAKQYPSRRHFAEKSGREDVGHGWSSLSYVHSQQWGGFNAAWIGVTVLGVGALLLPWLGRPQPARHA